MLRTLTESLGFQVRGRLNPEGGEGSSEKNKQLGPYWEKDGDHPRGTKGPRNEHRLGTRGGTDRLRGRLHKNTWVWPYLAKKGLRGLLRANQQSPGMSSQPRTERALGEVVCRKDEGRSVCRREPVW